MKKIAPRYEPLCYADEIFEAMRGTVCNSLGLNKKAKNVCVAAARHISQHCHSVMCVWFTSGNISGWREIV